MIAVAAIGALLLLLIRQLVAALAPAWDQLVSLLTVIPVISIAPVIVWLSLRFRCPQCESSLLTAVNPRFCPRCGVRLRE